MSLDIVVASEIFMVLPTLKAGAQSALGFRVDGEQIG